MAVRHQRRAILDLFQVPALLCNGFRPCVNVVCMPRVHTHACTAAGGRTFREAALRLPLGGEALLALLHFECPHAVDRKLDDRPLRRAAKQVRVVVHLAQADERVLRGLKLDKRAAARPPLPGRVHLLLVPQYEALHATVACCVTLRARIPSGTYTFSLARSLRVDVRDHHRRS